MRKNIPAKFKKYFWDSDFSRINQADYSDFALGRLMQYGGLDAIIWVKKNFGDLAVRAYLKKSGCKTLDKRSYVFWEKITH